MKSSGHSTRGSPVEEKELVCNLLLKANANYSSDLPSVSPFGGYFSCSQSAPVSDFSSSVFLAKKQCVPSVRACVIEGDRIKNVFLEHLMSVMQEKQKFIMFHLVYV
ncbi:hypothetical protein EK904_004235 [Melospiza melodia maxima]|nr:hypothetical protein EK904_004235 [Melospiza melodia maxima]